jgi:phosphate transport system protein
VDTIDPGGGADPPGSDAQPLRHAFDAELDQLRMQIQVMAMRVADALERMHEVLASGDPEVAETALAADDDVDAMHVSLTERCYDLIRREQPVASDLRFLVSVLRLLEELERIADLSLRVVHQAPHQPLLVGYPGILATLDHMADAARQLYRDALDAWTTQDLAAVEQLAEQDRAIDDDYASLVGALLALEGANAVQVAVTAVLVGQAVERIADHTVIVGERLRYLVTGDAAYLASEVR